MCRQDGEMLRCIKCHKFVCSLTVRGSAGCVDQRTMENVEEFLCPQCHMEALPVRLFSLHHFFLVKKCFSVLCANLLRSSLPQKPQTPHCNMLDPGIALRGPSLVLRIELSGAGVQCRTRKCKYCFGCP